MKHVISITALLVLCSLLFCGCFSDGRGDIAGDDWRTTGEVVGRGTIEREGEGTDVLVTLDDETVYFYLNSIEKELFDSADFPMNIPDAKSAFERISIEDADGDGNSDIMLYLYFDDGSEACLVWIWDGRFVFDEKRSFSTSGNSDETVSFFERNGLEINCKVEGGTYLLKNGMCTYTGFGDGFNNDDCYWEVTKTGDYKHDGIREIEFTAYCYIPESSIPVYDEQFMTVVSGELYDYYSGMWLTAATAYSDTERGENHYLHRVEWGGETYEIEFFYSTEWSNAAGDWGSILKKSYICYMPEDYDGLIFAAQAECDNYKDTATRMQLDSISPEANILACKTVDPYTSLYFALCK